MLKIPLPGDRPPPLVVPLKTPPREEVTVEAVSMTDGRRRKRKSRRGEDHSWDRDSGGAFRSRRHEKKQMIWWLAGGSALFVSIVIAVLAAMNGASKPPAVVVSKPKVEAPVVKSDASTGILSDVEFARLAEPMARTFLEAKSIDEVLPLARNPLVAEPRMKTLYPDRRIPPVGLDQFNTDSEIVHEGEHLTVKVRTKNFDERNLTFFNTPDGLKIDWESWAAWSEMPWKDFLAKKPAEPLVFRVSLSSQEYYNMSFTDDAKWQSYQLTCPGQDKSIYGYVERNSALDQQLRRPSDEKSADLTLKLRFPANARSDNQVLIEGIVSESWVIDTEPSP